MKILLATVYFYSSFGWSIAEALKRRGADVQVFDYRKGLRSRVPGLRTLLIQRMNRRLLKVAAKFKPDLIFIAKGEHIFPETLQEIRRVAGCPLINWFPDPRPMAYENVARSLLYYDYFFSKNLYWNNKLHEIGMSNVHLLAHSYDVEIQKRLTLSQKENDNFGSDLSFIGSMYPYRVRALQEIQDFDFKIWGPGWNTLSQDHPMRQYCQGRDIRGLDHTRVINASRINLNFHHYDDIEGVNQRFFDIAGCGGFQIVDAKKDISRFLKPEEEVICYRNTRELRKRIQYFLDHPDEREEIRMNGFKRIQSGNTYDDRMNELFDIVRV